LPQELRNTLANLYYRFNALAKNLNNPSRILGYNNSTPELAFKGFIHGMSDLLPAIEFAKDLVTAMRETRIQDMKLYEYQLVLTLDILKYNITNPHKKSSIRRAIERKFKTPNEIDGMYELMKNLKSEP
jgi:hypothetical protein